MEHEHHHHATTGLKKTSFMATLHCLTGCAIGEVIGMSLGSFFGWPNIETVIVSIILAFVFGYSLTLIPILKTGMNLKKALSIAFAADTVSITIMEIVDNAIMIVIPGAMDAPITSPFFWGSLVFALVVAFIAAFPVNMFLISKGRGHAAVHSMH